MPLHLDDDESHVHYRTKKHKRALFEYMAKARGIPLQRLYESMEDEFLELHGAEGKLPQDLQEQAYIQEVMRAEFATRRFRLFLSARETALGYAQKAMAIKGDRRAKAEILAREKRVVEACDKGMSYICDNVSKEKIDALVDFVRGVEE